jgi:pimeloyl-ACP methyl ester carboxylesterase
MRYLYLHGFASGAKSRKAQAFRLALEARGIQLEIPALDEGDFEHLTISAQLRVVERTLHGEPARIAGSSMGGYLAALYASTHPEVERLVLLAPAFSFSERWDDLVKPEGMAAWRETGWLEVFHYGEARMRRIHYDLYRDALTHPASPDFTQPARIFHGVNDTVVPIELSRNFAAAQANASLTECDSDHELLSVLPEITEAAIEFLTTQSTGSQTR